MHYLGQVSCIGFQSVFRGWAYSISQLADQSLSLETRISVMGVHANWHCSVICEIRFVDPSPRYSYIVVLDRNRRKTTCAGIF